MVTSVVLVSNWGCRATSLHSTVSSKISFQCSWAFGNLKNHTFPTIPQTISNSLSKKPKHPNKQKPNKRNRVIDLPDIRLCNSTASSQAYFKAYDELVLRLIAWACKDTSLNEANCSVFSGFCTGGSSKNLPVGSSWCKEDQYLLWVFNALV